MNKNKNAKQHQCPLDGRMFATKSALAQHRAAAHASQPRVGSQVARRKNPQPFARGPNSEAVVRFARTERWTTISINNQTNAEVKAGGGRITFSMADKSPNLLRKMAALFEMYRVHSVGVAFKSSTSSYKSGQVIIGVDYSPATADTNTKDSIVAYKHAVMRLSESKSISIVVAPNLDRYVTAKDENRDKPFAIAWWIDYPEGVAEKTELVMGELYITYDISFRGMHA